MVQAVPPKNRTITWQKEVFEVVDWDQLSRKQEARCTPQHIQQLNAEAAQNGLPSLDQLDQQSYYLEEMFDVEHGEEDLWIKDQKKGTKQRLIYAAPQELEADERQKLQAFEKFLNHLQYPVPEEYRTDDRLMFRLLAAEKYDHAKTLHHMIEHSTWRRETFPVSYSMIAAILKSGFLYVCGRDKNYRPILILNVRKIVDVDYSIEVINAASAFFCDFVMRKLLIAGVVENWIMIIDLNDVGMTSLPVKKVQAIVGMTQKHFGGRLFRQFCVNMGFMMRKSSSIFLNFVDDITQQKISVHNETNYKPELLKYVNPACYERKYGGQLPDIEQGFFPPQINHPGATLLSFEDLKDVYPESIRYMAPWGLKKVEEQKQLQKQQAMQQKQRLEAERLRLIEQARLESEKSRLAEQTQKSQTELLVHEENSKPTETSYIQETLPTQEAEVEGAVDEEQVQQICDLLLCEEFGACQLVYWYDVVADKDDEGVKMLTELKEYI